MKVYMILLGILYLLRLLVSIWTLTYLPHFLFIIQHLGDMVLFSLCMAGGIAFAYGKHILKFDRGTWKLISRLTLILGAYTVLLYVKGDEVFGIPAPASGGGLFQILMIFLPYVLFSIPVIVYEHELSKKNEAQD
jgi:hypothetical protein